MIRLAWRKGRFWDAAGRENEGVPLSQLEIGQSAQIVGVDGPTDVVHRLQEMGLRPGTIIQVFRPGNPCILRLGGGKLCVRTEDGAQILVRPVPGHHGWMRGHRHGWEAWPGDVQSEPLATAGPSRGHG